MTFDPIVGIIVIVCILSGLGLGALLVHIWDSYQERKDRNHKTRRR